MVVVGDVFYSIILSRSLALWLSSYPGVRARPEVDKGPISASIVAGAVFIYFFFYSTHTRRYLLYELCGEKIFRIRVFCWPVAGEPSSNLPNNILHDDKNRLKGSGRHRWLDIILLL